MTQEPRPGGSLLQKEKMKAYYHLPGLFEFYELYKVWLPIYRNHPEYFYDWCEIGSIYGAPADALWGGGRVGFGDASPARVAALMEEYGISARLTFSNSLLEPEHLSDVQCNRLCALFEKSSVDNGIILHSEFRYVVPDFRLNKELQKLETLADDQKQKVEFLCNECCWFDCYDRKACYENVSRKSLGEDCPEHHCVSPTAQRGYRFSDAMTNPGFIGIDDILNTYLPLGFSNFKIEGRGLGSAMVLEFLLYYLTKPEYQIHVREAVYLDSMLDLF